MLTITRRFLARSRGQILGWGISLALLGLYTVSLYGTLAQQREQFERLFEAYPPELFAFFGGIADLFSPAGYITTYFFSYMPIVLGIYSVLAGSGLLAADEENGTLDLILAHPVSRSAVFFGRLLGYLGALLGILVLSWVGFVALLSGSGLEMTPWQMVLPHISLFALLALVGCVALLLSMVLPSRSLAATVAGVLLVGNFFLASLANLNPDLAPIADLLPFAFFQSGEAIHGLDLGALGMLATLTTLTTALAWWLFQRRDIRVGGEGGWRLPRLRRRSAVEPG